MKRLILLALCIQLSGCPISYQASIRNETERSIGLVWDGITSESKNVDPGQFEPVPMAWGTQCLTVVDENQPASFRLPKRLPKGVRTTGRFDSFVGFVLVYDGSNLSFETEDGRQIPMEIVDSCEQ